MSLFLTQFCGSNQAQYVATQDKDSCSHSKLLITLILRSTDTVTSAIQEPRHRKHDMGKRIINKSKPIKI